MDEARPAERTGGTGAAGSYGSGEPPGRSSTSPPGGRVRCARLGLLAASVVVATAAGVVTGVRWEAEPAADLAALVVHVGVLSVGVAGMLGALPLPRGRRSGLGLALMAISMLVLFAEPAWNLGPLATSGFLVTFMPGIWLVAGPAGSRPAIVGSGDGDTSARTPPPVRADPDVR